MHGTTRCLLVLICLIFFASESSAQNTLISGEFNNTRFPDFVKQVEAAGTYRLYYDDAALDSFTITARFDAQTLPVVLGKVFEHTGFLFAIDATNHVFITRNKAMQTTLAPGFFKPGQGLVEPDNEAIQSEDAKKQKIKNKFTENKLFEIGEKSSAKKSTAVLTGLVRDIKNGEAMP